MSAWKPIGNAETMIAMWLWHPYYSHGQVRHGYRNRKGEWIGINANGTEGKLNFDPKFWQPIPGAPSPAEQGEGM